MPLTLLQQKLAEAVSAHRELESEEARTKLSREAFVALAEEYSGSTLKHLIELETALDESTRLEGVKTFIRTMGLMFEKVEITQPPPARKFAQFANVYGNESLNTDLVMWGPGAFCEDRLRGHGGASRAAYPLDGRRENRSPSKKIEGQIWL